MFTFNRKSSVGYAEMKYGLLEYSESGLKKLVKTGLGFLCERTGISSIQVSLFLDDM